MFDKKRRKFITLLGGAVAGPFNARAQDGGQVRLVGIFYDTSRGADPAIMSEIAAFKEALQRLGWSEGRNIRFEGPFNLPDSATRQKLAKELVALKVDVILTSGTPATAAFFAETRTIPIVFVNASDPIGSGFAVSLAHPDGNVTGFVKATVGQKRLELLKEIAPRIRRVRVIFNPETAVSGGRYFFEPIEMAARTQQIEAVALPVRSARDIERAIAVTADLSDVGVISHTGCLHLHVSGLNHFIDDPPPPTLRFRNRCFCSGRRSPRLRHRSIGTSGARGVLRRPHSERRKARRPANPGTG